MPVGYHQTMEPREAVGPLAAGFSGSTPRRRRGCSLFPSAIGLIPAVKRLLGRVRHVSMSAPGVEAVVDNEARQVSQRDIGGGDRRAIGGWPRQQFAGNLHFGPLGQRSLMPLDEHPSPRIDLLVDVDLHRTNIGATAIECRSEWQIAVFSLIEGRVDNQTDRAGVSGAVAEPTA